VKYAYELVLLAKEETVQHGIIDKIIEIGGCYGMEMKVKKTKLMRISRQLFSGKNYDKKTRKCGIFLIFG
jgi:hypothetical protein